jgi:hypothetical protein
MSGTPADMAIAERLRLSQLQRQHPEVTELLHLTIKHDITEMVARMIQEREAQA